MWDQFILITKNYDPVDSYTLLTFLIPSFVVTGFSGASDKFLRDVMSENGMLVLIYENNRGPSLVELVETKWLQSSKFIRLDPAGGMKIYMMDCGL